MIYDKLPVVLLSTMASEKSSSTNHTIAAFILSHAEDIPKMSITDLAQACYVGTGSVSRFVRDIGLTDFAQLKQLCAEFAMRSFENKEETDPIVRQSHITEYIVSDMRTAAASVDPEQLEKICRDIQSYENIYAFGLLKAQSAAVSLQTDLLMAGKTIHTSTAFAEQMDTIINAGKEDLILIFSYTGTYFSSHAFRAKEKHLILPKIWMICGNDSGLPSFVDEVLLFESQGKKESHPFTLELMASLIAEEYSYMINHDRSGNTQ